MTFKGKFAIGLLSTVFSGLGTYELLRANGGFSLGVIDRTNMPMDGFDDKKPEEEDKQEPSEEDDAAKEEKSGAKSGAKPEEKESKGKDKVDTEEKKTDSSRGSSSDSEDKSNSETSKNSDGEGKQPAVATKPDVGKSDKPKPPIDKEGKKDSNASDTKPESKVPDSTVNNNPKQTDNTKTVVEVGNGGNDEGKKSTASTDTSKSTTSKAEKDTNSEAPKTDSNPDKQPNQKDTSSAKSPTKAEEKDDSNGGKSSEDKATVGKSQTYREYIDGLEINKGKKILWVDENTSVDDIKNMMLQKMFPQYRRSFVWHENRMFLGSPSVHFVGEWHEKGSRKIYILKKHTNEEVEKLRRACMEALKRKKPEDQEGKMDKQVYKIRY